MIYVLNLYDIVDGKEETYKEYVRQSVLLMDGIEVEPVVACHKPLKEMSGNSRGHMIIARFGSMKDFDFFMERQEDKNIQNLREESTENYIWTMYEEWDLGAWLNP